MVNHHIILQILSVPVALSCRVLRPGTPMETGIEAWQTSGPMWGILEASLVGEHMHVYYCFYSSH